jgi:peptidoglycan L-alanyl-D-glutamate endopeptidase CwlK
MSKWADINAVRLGQVHPVLAARISPFIARMEVLGVPILVTQGLRSWEEQAKLYDQGRTYPGPIVTKAQPGYSWHCFGLAVDLVPGDQEENPKPDWNEKHDNWKLLIKIGRDFELSEGALWRNFPDYPHFQPKELSVTPSQDIRDMFHKGGLAAVWAWFADYIKVNVKRA